MGKDSDFTTGWLVLTYGAIVTIHVFRELSGEEDDVRELPTALGC